MLRIDKAFNLNVIQFFYNLSTLIIRLLTLIQLSENSPLSIHRPQCNPSFKIKQKNYIKKISNISHLTLP